MNSIATFVPHRGGDPESLDSLWAALKHVEQHLSLQGASPVNAAQVANAQGAQASKTNAAISAGGGSGGAIPESQVIFSPSSGHAHDGSTSHTIALAGDVTGTNIAAVVGKIQGEPVPAPLAANDKQSLRWDNGGLTFAYVTNSTLSLLGNWCRADISTLGAADAEIENAGSTAVTKTIAHVMPVAGSLSALSARLSGDVGAAGNNVVFTVYLNGVATALTLTITGAAGTEDKGQVAVTPVPFAAGDLVTVEAKKVGAPAAVQAVVAVWGALTS